MMDPNIKIAQVEKHLNDSLLIISQQMSQVNESLMRIAEGVTSQDLVLGALRFLLVEQGVLQDKDIEAKMKELIALIRQKQEAKKEPKPQTVESEVEAMGKKFSTSDNKEHPDEAFFFGG